MTKINLAILLFTDAEVLDFAGPFEVFSVTDELNHNELLNVYTVGKTTETITAKNGLQVVADFDYINCPTPDILLVPGGFGTRAVLQDNQTIEWVRRTAQQCQKVLSVCSGALVLAAAGLLDGLKATTHHMLLDYLRELAPETLVVDDQRYVDNGKIITSGGISAGIDMSLYVVSILFSRSTAHKTALYMEYESHQ